MLAGKWAEGEKWAEYSTPYIKGQNIKAQIMIKTKKIFLAVLCHEFDKEDTASDQEIVQMQLISVKFKRMPWLIHFCNTQLELFYWVGNSPHA